MDKTPLSSGSSGSRQTPCQAPMGSSSMVYILELSYVHLLITKPKE